MMKTKITFNQMIPLLVLFFSLSIGWGQVALPGASPYTENFNTTPGGSGTSYPSGWSSYNGSTQDNAMTVGTGTSTTGANYNYGSRIGILGSGSAFIPGSIVLAITNTTDKTQLKISYDVIKIREQTRSNSFDLQISTTSATSGFSNVSGGAYASGSIAQNTVTGYTNIDISALDNNSGTVWVRWYYDELGGSGSRDGIALDNVSISWVESAIPSLTISETSLAFGSINNGSQSASQSFTVEGSNLTEEASVDASNGYEVSTDDVTFSNNVILPQTGGVLNGEPVEIFVRFSPNALGLNNGTITVSSTGAEDKTVNVSGTGVVPSPQLIVSTNSLPNFGNVDIGEQSSSQTFTVSGSALISNALLFAADDFVLSTDDSNFSSFIDLTQSGGELVDQPVTIYVRFAPSFNGATSGDIEISADGATTQIVSVSGTGTTPIIGAPTATAATLITENSFVANWNAVPGATSYRLDVSTSQDFSTSAPGQTTTEIFSSIGGGTSSSYLTRTWTGVDNIQWTAYNSRTDQVVNSGNPAIALRDASGAYLVSETISGGIVSLSFDAKQVFSGSGGILTVRVFHGDGLTTETNLGSLNYNTTTSTFTSPTVNIEGDFYIRIDNNTAARPAIDNLAFTRNTTLVPFFIEENVTVNGTSQVVDDLDQNTTYYYRVRAFNGTTSVNSNTISVLTLNPTLWYADTDNDNFGDDEDTILAVDQPDGYVAIGGDCDDENDTVYPGAAEICYDGLDNDCNGTIDDGCTPIVTVVQPSQCGITLAAVNSYVYANIVPGAQGYRFRVTNLSTNQVQSIDQLLRAFRITQLTNYAFDTEYSVEVSVRINNVWQPFYGTPCNVSTPDTTTQVQASQCNTTLTNVTNTIFADIVPFATGYRFRVTNTLNPVDVQTIDRPIRDFKMSMLSNIQFNTTYNVEVAVRNTDGTYLSYGSICDITTPLFPTVGLQDAQCDDYAVSSNTETLYADSYPGAQQYRFLLENVGQPYSQSFDRPIRTVTLNNFTGLLPSTTYTVRVAIQLNGVWGPYGKSCSIITPAAARPEGVARVDENNVNEFKAVAYPNPFATSFAIDVRTSNTEKVSLTVYDMTGRLLESNEVNAADATHYQFGERYPSGVYNVIVTQGEETRTVRVVKQ